MRQENNSKYRAENCIFDDVFLISLNKKEIQALWMYIE